MDKTSITEQQPPTEREMQLAQEIADSLDAVLAQAYMLEDLPTDLPLARKWPAFSPQIKE